MAMATRSSEDIKKDVVDQLYWDGRVNAASVEVVAVNNELTIR
jgi:hypothetical protein